MASELNNLYRKAIECRSTRCEVPAAPLTLEASFSGWVLKFTEKRLSEDKMYYECRIHWHHHYIMSAGGYTVSEMLENLELRLSIVIQGVTSMTEFVTKSRSDLG